MTEINDGSITGADLRGLRELVNDSRQRGDRLIPGTWLALTAIAITIQMLITTTDATIYYLLWAGHNGLGWLVTAVRCRGQIVGRSQRLILATWFTATVAIWALLILTDNTTINPLAVVAIPLWMAVAGQALIQERRRHAALAWIGLALTPVITTLALPSWAAASNLIVAGVVLVTIARGAARAQQG
ncbi:MAG: hypothetical protein ACYTF0_00250 [Planctomycetota bacterium]|jgi:hypothetical protein